MKHDVHLYAVVRVKVKGVEADSDEEAIQAALEKFYEDHRLRDRFSHTSADVESEFADDVEGFLVDHEGDEEYLGSAFYCADGVTDAMGRCFSCGRPHEK